MTPIVEDVLTEQEAAAQLGSSVATVHGTYARFKPTLDERHAAKRGAK